MKGDVQHPLKPLFIQAFIALMVIIFCLNLRGSGRDTGYKYIENYRPEDYQLHPQNWAILQAKNNLIYVGNHGGLLEFDGVSWQEIKVPNKTVRSMALGSDGVIYIGGIDEIGFLVPDKMGRLHFESLTSYIPVNKRHFSIVWKTLSTEDGIYFGTFEYLFCWKPKEKKMNICIEASEPNYLKAFFKCGETIFVRKGETGLMQVKGGELVLVSGGDLFAADSIFMMAPYDNETERILIGSPRKGFYLFDPKNDESPKPFPTEVDDYIRIHMLHHGIRLSSGNFALATLTGGLVIMDPQGHLLTLFNKDYGLQDDSVKYVLEDLQGSIWLGLEIGISRIEYSSPVSMYDSKRSNPPGLVLSVIRHGPENTLYAGTTRGLYYRPVGNKFQEVQGISVSCWSLLSLEDVLLAATENGVSLIENNISRRKIIHNNSFVLYPSHRDRNRIWVGTDTGLVSLYRDKSDTGWLLEHRFSNIGQEIRTLVEDSFGNLWLGISPNGVLKVDFPKGIIDPSVYPIGYDENSGLPGGEVYVYSADNHAWFGTSGGLYIFNEKENRFVSDYRFGAEYADGTQPIWRLVMDSQGSIWFNSKHDNYQAIPLSSDSYKVFPKPILSFLSNQVNSIYPDPQGKVIWFARNDGLLRYDTGIKDMGNQDYPALIRQVLVNEKPIFIDYKCDIINDTKSGHSLPLIPYNDRNLRFEFATPFFLGKAAVQYQHYLDGYDTNWSNWSLETRKDYTNLDSGQYCFRVRAKNLYKRISKEGEFYFKVLPPWFKTWWAFLLYITGTFLTVYFIVKWRSWRLHQEKQKLETIIKERTKEINQKNQQLEQQTFQLQEQSERLKEIDHVKSRFFANISHEFRTPLTLIMGPLEQMLSNPGDKEQKSKLNLMLRNSQRLLNLINQLLDLSKLDSGKMKIQATSQNIILFLKGILDSFQFLATQNSIELSAIFEEEEISLYFDTEKLEKVICNLLSNAIKFTFSNGRITVKVKRKPITVERFPEGFLEIVITDNGIGIPREQLPYIFDRFYQARLATEHERKGSGIGLALTKELVTLHAGEIEARSSDGTDGTPAGTEFILRLPLGKAHLKPTEIVDLSGKHPSHRQVYDLQDVNSIDFDDEEICEKELDVESQDSEIILVVEDSTDVRKYIREPLSAQYSVVEAVNGKDGIQKAKEIIPDLIISDIMMPEVDGYELCQTLKKEVTTSHIPIILLTAKASEDNIVQGLEIGADDYITKPFNTKILLARIKNLIDLRRQVQQRLKRQMMLQPEEISVSSIDEEFLKELQKIIEQNLSNSEFTVEELGRKLYLSRATLYRKIQALSGESPNQFIRSYRLKRAAQLLKENFGNITEVAFEVGFSSSAYFTKCFKEQFQQLPSSFQVSEGFNSPSVLS